MYVYTCMTVWVLLCGEEGQEFESCPDWEPVVGKLDV